jgi:hypothetical protein
MLRAHVQRERTASTTWHQSANGDLENMNSSMLGLATTFSLTLLAFAVPAAANAQANRDQQPAFRRQAGRHIQQPMGHGISA